MYFHYNGEVDLQQLVVSGKFGNSPGVPTPFVNLSREQLVQELRRNVLVIRLCLCLGCKVCCVGLREFPPF